MEFSQATCRSGRSSYCKPLSSQAFDAKILRIGIKGLVRAVPRAIFVAKEVPYSGEASEVLLQTFKCRP